VACSPAFTAPAIEFNNVITSSIPEALFVTIDLRVSHPDFIIQLYDISSLILVKQSRFGRKYLHWSATHYGH
jgi:hypothetical protein